MRLLQKTNRLYLGLAVAIFAAGGLVFYVLINHVVSHKTDESLYALRSNIQAFALKNDTFPTFFNTIDNQCHIKKIENNAVVYTSILDTLILNPTENNELEPYRQLVFTQILRGANYEITLRQSSLETEDLVFAILTMTLLVVVLLILMLFFVNRSLSKKIWQPFYDTLKQVKSVDINDSNPLHFKDTDIDEFKELNETIQKMTFRLKQDYQNLKEFTDNASHELQTPLTVMQSKLENLFQDDTLTDNQSRVLSDLYQQTTRLSRLSQTLLLLSKIENQQYSNTQSLDFKILIEQKQHQFEDLISDKNIIVETQFSKTSPLSINPVLADILVSNLIGNAIRHNKEGGQIHISLENEAFSIKNTGKKDLGLDKMKIFQRFFKDNAESHSFGLGLALVQQIADNQKWQTAYDFENGQHVFKISFTKA